ncbi:bifunctional 4-hydroxy-2-oxoglutarate aldolase/2-dehydro-3-deoxy-phosphogluconate aldolase [Phytoactinopolyspora halotolerans]|uniref:Bifunctional 4-hydroxy-2-oxoglutarate aldolase/2-dehydro-3-deoxy-phosphogluconate aldolase n=1 Tax=Phytoactinopolyspora halotolerans TaxID=1981512 RepID=A0A6L9SEP4_9ACTN|nr:bifunctional 4-hydroxy-2-oxoglutarate aldolase/2-dehydro-3-deoxy-phosphogluconate aldolase [Phytoactinopolyspora halotolerans]NEE03124.1 bifunctional 4-hydroxy-2-oxoglutarate aldolase/2-dehydro-3-deoxy-phosphogluconate aldolase [Phytoactinopolyspora halotolerans]
MSAVHESQRVAPSAQLRDTGVMAILRASAADRFSDIARTLVDAGVTCLEITLTSPGALGAIAAVRAELPDTVDVGAGTVTTADDVRAVVDAGAGFVVSPSAELDVVRAAAEAGIPSYPGAFSPTEILAAWRAGASAVKVFPAATLGTSYFTYLAGPFPDIPLMPTGGVGLDTIGDWIRAGAIGVGLGSPLQGDAATGGDLEQLAGRARRALEEVRAARAATA